MGFRLSSVTGQNSPSVGISSKVDVGVRKTLKMVL